MKIHLHIIWILPATLFLRCSTQPASAVPPSSSEIMEIMWLLSEKKIPAIPPVQMEWLRMSNNKKMNTSWWRFFERTADSLPDPAPIIHIFSGNLDQDDDLETVIWFTTGSAFIFDWSGKCWKCVGEASLDFWHGNQGPKIDQQLHALEIQSYGWGSGCAATRCHYVQVSGDSCRRILYFLKKEGSCCLTGTSVARSITGKYKTINDTTIVINTDYILRYLDEDSKHNEEIIFRGNVNIPYLWDSRQGRFIPHPPKELDVNLIDSEFIACEGEFDNYFDNSVQKLKQTGPIWMREALGNGGGKW